MTRYKIRLKTLSPLHIGGGGELSYLDYVVLNNKLCHIDIPRVCDKIQGETLKKFEEYVTSSNYKEMNSLVFRICAKLGEKAPVHVRIPISAQLIEEYALFVDGKKRDPNQGLVSLMPRDYGTDRAYIPGSSLKGALRTTLAASFLNEFPSRHPKKNGSYKFENSIFAYNYIDQDRFKYLHVRDFFVPQDQTTIEKVYRWQANGNDFSQNSLSERMELIEPGTELDGEIQIKKGIEPFYVDPERLFADTNKFYMQVFEKNFKNYYKHINASWLEKEIKLMSTEGNVCLLALGKNVGRSAKALDDKRLPKSFAATERNYPLGWVKMYYEKI